MMTAVRAVYNHNPPSLRVRCRGCGWRLREARYPIRTRSPMIEGPGGRIQGSDFKLEFVISSCACSYR